MRYVFLFLLWAVFVPSVHAGETGKREGATPPAAHDHGEMDDSKINKEFLNKKIKLELAYGKKDAPVTMIEYASLSCSHCKDFHENVIAQVKKDYIDAGKVRYVFRYFPLNLPALRASMLVQCVADENRQKLFLDALFKAQSEWAFSESEEAFTKKLRTIAKIGGMEDKTFDKCLADKDLEKELLEHQLAASKELGITSTPTLFINNKRFMGPKSLERVNRMIDAMLNGGEAKPEESKPAAPEKLKGSGTEKDGVKEEKESGAAGTEEKK